MILTPLLDFFDGVLAVLTGFSFFVVANINLPVIILLEATLLRRQLPGTRAFRNAVVMNITTFLMGAGVGLLLEGPIYFLADMLPEWSWIPTVLLAILAGMGLTVLLEGGILKFLEPDFPPSRIWRTTLIVNIASYAVLGVSVGLVALGYDYQDSRGGGIGIVYLLTQCGVPLACAALFIGLMFENFISAQAKSKPTIAVQDEIDGAESVSVQTPLSSPERKITPTREEDIEKPIPKVKLQPMAETVGGGEIGWRAYAIWILATAIGAGIGFGVSGAVILKLKSLGGIIWSVLLLGVGIGGAQWFIIRRYLQKSGWWILTTIGAWAFTLAIASRASVLLKFKLEDWTAEENWTVLVLGILVVGLILGIIIGTLQWFVLRKQFHNSHLWILISAIGWFISINAGSFAGTILYNFLQHYSIWASRFADINPLALIIWPVIFAGIITGGIVGATTGILLVRFLQSSAKGNHPIPEERTPLREQMF